MDLADRLKALATRISTLLMFLTLFVLMACAPTTTQPMAQASVCQSAQKGKGVKLAVLSLNATLSEVGKAVATCLGTLGWDAKTVGGVDFEPRLFDQSEYGIGLDFGQYVVSDRQLKATHTVGIKTKAGMLLSSTKFETVQPLNQDILVSITKAGFDDAVKAALIAHELLLKQ